MKKIVALFVLLSVLGLKSKAQEQYVEVLVTDTVLAEPQQWTIYLSIQKTYTELVADTTSMTTPTHVEEKKGTSVDALKAIVKKYNGEIITTVVSKPVGRYSYDIDGSLTVKFKSRQSMEGLLSAVENMEDVSAQIFSVELADMSGPQNMLYAKLMAAAKGKASSLAQLSGKTLGPVVSVAEVTETEANAFKQFFQTLLQLESKSELARTLSNTSPDKLKLEKSLKVRFAFK